jgi:hypothetical protein
MVAGFYKDVAPDGASFATFVFFIGSDADGQHARAFQVIHAFAAERAVDEFLRRVRQINVIAAIIAGVAVEFSSW